MIDAEDGGDDEAAVVDKMSPTHMFPLPPFYSSGRNKATSNSSAVANATAPAPTARSDNVSHNGTGGGPVVGPIFTTDSGFGLNKLSYVGPIVMGFGGNCVRTVSPVINKTL